MSYGLAGALQSAVFAALDGDAELGNLVGGVFDAVPTGAPDIYVALGPERVSDRSDATGHGAIHVFRISVVTTHDGFAVVKAAGARIAEILGAGDLTLGSGRLISLQFKDAAAKRDRRDGTRRVDLTFRARTEL